MASFRSLKSDNNAINIAKILNDESKMNGLRDDDYNRIKNLLKSTNIQVRLKQCDNDTLLHLAIRRKDVKLIEWFLIKSDLTMKNDFGETPYDLAVKLQYNKEILIKLLREDEIIPMNDMNEDFYIELRSKITSNDCDKLKFIKVAKIVDYEFVLSSAIDENFCDIFPNLFALQIEIQRHDEENCLKLIKSHFNDGRPMFVNFIASEKFFLIIENSNEFTAITSDDNNARIINTKTLISSEVVDLIKSNDTFAMRYLKLFKIPNEFKVIDSAIEFGSFEMFLAALSAPFDCTKIENYLPDISKMMRSTHDDKSVLMSAIKSDKIRIINFIIKRFKRSIKFLPFEHKKSIVNLISDKNLDDILISLLNIDFPFPENVNNNNESIKKLLKDRQKLRSDDLEDVKEFVEQNKSVKIGYDKKNQSALLYAIENKNIQIYSFLLSEGYHCDDPIERVRIQKIIRKLSDDSKNELRDENEKNSKSDGNNHIRLLTNKFVIFTHYEDKDEFTANFNKISNYLTELNEVYELRKLLKFCAELQMLKVTIDCNNNDIETVDPTSLRSLGIAYDDNSVFISVADEKKAKSTLIHELTHIALLNYYENYFNPYFAYDNDSCNEFENICVKIRDYLKTNDDQCDKIISSVFKDYDEDEFHSELIVRVLEILAYYKNDNEKINNLRDIYSKLFHFSEKHVTNALSLDEYSERLKIRSGNKYFGLIQEIEKKNTILKLSKKSKNTKKVEKIIKSDKSQLIVTNIPILALVNIKKYLNGSQDSLYDSKNVFISTKYIENDQIYRDFQEIIKNSSEKLNTIADFSADHHIRVLDDNSKLIIITTEQNLKKRKEIMSKKKISYEEKTLKYRWNDLTLNSQEFLMQTEIKFQNKTLKLNEITNGEVIEDELLLKLCYEHEIIINPPSNDKSKFYIERTFAKVAVKSYQLGDILPFASIHDISFMIHQDNQNEEKFNIHYVKEAKVAVKSYHLGEILPLASIHDISFMIHQDNQYEEKFNIHYVNKTEQKYSMDEAITKTAYEKIVLISDIGGSGKSRVLKEMSKRLMNNCNDWILFVNLGEYLTEFLLWEDEKTSINFLKFFNAHFGKNLTEFEKKFFEKFYSSGKVKILFDVFDEISPNCKDFVFKLIKSIEFFENNSPMDSQNSSNIRHNQIWITTRKHLEDYLQKELKINEVFSLKPLEPYEQKKFVMQYWKSKDVNDSNEILEESSRKLLIKVFNFTANKGNLIGMMQQLQILAEISIKLNMNSIENFTMYDIYNSSVRKFYEKWKNTATWAETYDEMQLESTPSYAAVHQYFALLTYYKEEFVKQFFSQYTKIWELQSIEKGNIISYVNNKPFFIHATYAEFFIANFIIQQLKNDNSHLNDILYIFCDILQKDHLVTVHMFINDEIKNLEFSEVRIEKFAKHLSEILTPSHFYLPLFLNHINILSFLFRIFEKLDGENFKCIIKNKQTDNLLYMCMLTQPHRNSKIFNAVFNSAIIHLSDKEFIDLIEERGSYEGYTILHAFAFNEITIDLMKEMMQIIIEKCKKIKRPLKELLLTRCDRSSLPLFKMVQNINLENFEKLEYFWGIYEKYLSCEEMNANVFFDTINTKSGIFCFATLSKHPETIKFVHKKFQSSVGSNFSDIISKWMSTLPCNQEYLVHKYMWKIISNECNSKQSNRSKISKFLFPLKNTEDSFLLDLVAYNDSHEILKLTLTKVIEIVPNQSRILDLIDECGKNILQVALSGERYSLEYFEDLLYYLKKMCNNDNRKLKRFLQHDDEFKNNAFYIAFCRQQKNVIQKILEFAEEIGMSYDDIKQFVLPKQRGRYRNMLHFVVERTGDIELLKYAWEIVEKYLKNSDEIVEMITESDKRDVSLFQLTVACNSEEYAEFNLNKIKFYLKTNEKLKDYISKLGYRGKSLYELSARNMRIPNIKFWTEKLYESLNLEIPAFDPKNNQDKLKVSKLGTGFRYTLTGIEDISDEKNYFNFEYKNKKTIDTTNEKLQAFK